MLQKECKNEILRDQIQALDENRLNNIWYGFNKSCLMICFLAHMVMIQLSSEFKEGGTNLLNDNAVIHKFPREVSPEMFTLWNIIASPGDSTSRAIINGPIYLNVSGKLWSIGKLISNV